MTGTSRRPYITQAMPAPITTSTSAAPLTTVKIPCDVGGEPTTGDRKLTSRLSMIRNPPAQSEPIASTIIGEVMIGGASCGCTLSSQRRSPVKVMNTTRVM